MSSARLTLGTFNVLNLVPGSTPEMRHFFYKAEPKQSYWAADPGDSGLSAYEQKLHWLARQIDLLNCDAIAFQEVFDEAPLREAIALSSWNEHPHTLVMGGAPSFVETEFKGTPARVYNKPRVALLVRGDWQVEAEVLDAFPAGFDFHEPLTGRDGSERAFAYQRNGEPVTHMYRPALRCVLTLPEWSERLQGVPEGERGQVVVYAAHFKSKAPMSERPQVGSSAEKARQYARENALGIARSAMIRNVDAAAVRWRIIEDLEGHPERPVVLMGDLNDELEAISTDVAGGLSVPYFSRDDYPDDDRELMRHVSSDLALYSTARRHARKTQRDVFYTFFWDGQHNTLDHILVSRHFIPHWMREDWGSPEVGDVGSLRVFNDHLMDDMLDELEHWQVSKYHARCSDHGQVVVRLDWNRRPKTATTS